MSVPKAVCDLLLSHRTANYAMSKGQFDNCMKNKFCLVRSFGSKDDIKEMKVANSVYGVCF